MCIELISKVPMSWIFSYPSSPLGQLWAECIKAYDDVHGQHFKKVVTLGKNSEVSCIQSTHNIQWIKTNSLLILTSIILERDFLDYEK